MGLIGGGGSLLLPTFVYILERDTVLASAYTLLLVGITAIFGAVPRYLKREVDLATVLNLGIPIFVGTMIVRVGIHYIPDPLFSIGGLSVTKKMFVLLLFASILLLSFASMLGLIGRNLKPQPEMKHENPVRYFGMLIGGGLLIGIISAVVGAGGGVMMVPLLVVVMGLDMKTVVGTSLMIQAIKSPLSFFFADAIHLHGQIEWGFLSLFAVMMIVGVMAGTSVAKRVDGDKLKTGFAWFILAMAIFIFTQELFLSGETA